MAVGMKVTGNIVAANEHVPGARMYGQVDPQAVLRRLVSREQLLRSVRAELLPA